MYSLPCASRMACYYTKAYILNTIARYIFILYMFVPAIQHTCFASHLSGCALSLPVPVGRVPEPVTLTMCVQQTRYKQTSYKPADTHQQIERHKQRRHQVIQIISLSTKRHDGTTEKRAWRKHVHYVSTHWMDDRCTITNLLETAA